MELDLHIVEGAYEYKRKSGETVQGDERKRALREVVELIKELRQQEVPIRLFHSSAFGEEVLTDLVGDIPCFSESGYDENQTNIWGREILDLLGEKEEPVILFSGGYVRYTGTHLSYCYRSLNGIDASDLENFGGCDPSKQYAVISACVGARAARVYGFLLEKRRNPRVLIDPVSCVKDQISTGSKLDHSVYYELISLLQRGIHGYALTRKVPSDLL